MMEQLDIFEQLDRSHLPSHDGRDDMNLAEVILGVVRPGSGQRNKGKKTTPWPSGSRNYDITLTENEYRIEWRSTFPQSDGSSEEKTLYRSVECNRGLPGPHAEDILIALLKLTAEQHFEEDRISLTCHQLLDMMQWNKTKYYYRRLRETLHQLVGMSVHTNAIYHPEKNRYVERAFNIFSDMEISGDGRLKNADCYVRWAKGVFELFQMGYTKPLDTEFFYALDDPMTKRIYRWLDKHLRRTTFVEIDVLEFAHKIIGYGLSYSYPSQVTRKLNPKLNELHARGFCRWENVKDKSSPSGSKYVFHRITPYTSVIYPTRKNILDAMVERGVRKKIAVQLLQAYGWEPCLRQIEHLDYNLSQGNGPENPGGWLTRAIKYEDGTGYSLPDELEEMMMQARKETQRWCAEMYDAMTPAERKQLRSEIYQNADSATRRKLREEDESENRSLLLKLRNQHLLTRQRRPAP